MIPFTTWKQALKYQANNNPTKTAFTFLNEDGSCLRSLTFEELDQKATGLAILLLQQSSPKDRVLLLYPPGLDYVIAFYACVYARLISVPLYSPQNKRKIELIANIAKDCDAKLALTTSKYQEKVLSHEYPILNSINWLSTDNLDIEYCENWKGTNPLSEDLVYLQYTSGSTSSPKGVMLNNACTLYQSEELSKLWDTNSESYLVSWLPHFHDLGQVFAILQPIYKGFSCALISPAAFMKKPFTWLKAITDYKATHTAAPDFAFGYCVENISDDQKQLLNLSSLKTVVNGAEPVRKHTIDQFYSNFQECGFKEKAHCPSYGLAETTLVVSADYNRQAPNTLSIDADQLVKCEIKIATDLTKRCRTLVSNGESCLDTVIRIVDPVTHIALPEQTIGEIWVNGPGVGLGYWNKDDVTLETFKAQLIGNDQGYYLRTGDLGFKLNNQLYITGRQKDLVLIRGTNHYPQDIELTVERCHPILRNGYCAAFTVDVSGEEQLVIAVERERFYPEEVDFNKILQLVRNAVSEYHDLSLYRGLILKPGSISKTTSGKIQRQKCKTELANSLLKVVTDETYAVSPALKKDRSIKENKSSMETQFKTAFKTTIGNWISDWIKTRVNGSLDLVDMTKSFSYFGVSSIDTFKFHEELEVFLGCDIPEETIWDASSINELIESIVSISVMDHATV